MKTIDSLLRITFLLALLGTSPQSIALADKPDTAGVAKSNALSVGLYMSPEWKLNLRLASRQPGRVTVTLKDANNTVLYREYVKRVSVGYWRKFDFEGSEPGMYQFEISNGQQTIVRRVEIVNVPTVESQRYITYGPQTDL